MGKCDECEKEFKCQEDNSDMICGFDTLGKTYKMFQNKCAMTLISKCHKIGKYYNIIIKVPTPMFVHVNLRSWHIGLAMG